MLGQLRAFVPADLISHMLVMLQLHQLGNAGSCITSDVGIVSAFWIVGIVFIFEQSTWPKAIICVLFQPTPTCT